MSKIAEMTYLEKTGVAGREHNLGKPFLDIYCGVNLASIGTLIALLPPPPARILDMGCGAGWTSIFFAKHGYEVEGRDLSADMVDLARENQARQLVGGNLSFVVGDYESTGGDGQFDAVVFFDCLHHADDEGAAILTAYRALKPGGVMITHEPGEGHSTAPGSVEAMRVYGVNERDMPPWLIIKHAREVGFGKHRIYPMQHQILQFLYAPSVPRLFSKGGWLRIKRALRMAFKPSDRDSSIVVLTK